MDTIITGPTYELKHFTFEVTDKFNNAKADNVQNKKLLEKINAITDEQIKYIALIYIIAKLDSIDINGFDKTVDAITQKNKIYNESENLIELNKKKYKDKDKDNIFSYVDTRKRSSGPIGEIMQNIYNNNELNEYKVYNPETIILYFKNLTSNQKNETETKNAMKLISKIIEAYTVIKSRKAPAEYYNEFKKTVASIDNDVGTDILKNINMPTDINDKNNRDVIEVRIKQVIADLKKKYTNLNPTNVKIEFTEANLKNLQTKINQLKKLLDKVSGVIKNDTEYKSISDILIGGTLDSEKTKINTQIQEYQKAYQNIVNELFGKIDEVDNKKLQYGTTIVTLELAIKKTDILGSLIKFTIYVLSNLLASCKLTTGVVDPQKTCTINIVKYIEYAHLRELQNLISNGTHPLLIEGAIERMKPFLENLFKLAPTPLPYYVVVDINNPTFIPLIIAQTLYFYLKK